MENLTTFAIATNKTMGNTTTPLVKSAKCWVNRYDRFGNLSDSTPFASFANAEADTLALLSQVNPYVSDRCKYTRIFNNLWTAPNGTKIVIEDKGSILLHLQSYWTGLSASEVAPEDDANEDELNRCADLIRDDMGFIFYLYSTLGVDSKERWEEFADRYYTNPVSRAYYDKQAEFFLIAWKMKKDSARS